MGFSSTSPLKLFARDIIVLRASKYNWLFRKTSNFGMMGLELLVETRGANNGRLGFQLPIKCVGSRIDRPDIRWNLLLRFRD
jgi:hypothetical protein